MLRKMQISIYPHKSYLPILDRSKSECSSLLRMRRNNFFIVQNSISKHTLMSNILYTQALRANFNFFIFSDYLPLN